MLPVDVVFNWWSRGLILLPLLSFRRYPKYVALERAIEKEGLPVVILIRIAPYPYPLFNALFAASRVKFHTYAIGTAVSLVKVASSPPSLFHSYF